MVSEYRYPGEGRKRLFDLFPYGYVGQACKIAGIKRPRGWSTGWVTLIKASGRVNAV